MKRVGLIGLGNMGTGMAKNLVKKGFKLMVYDIRDEALEKMARLGAGVAASPQQVGEDSQVVFIMVLNGAQVKEVVTGKQGLLAGIKPGATVIISATILRSIMIEVAALLDAKGIEVIDCPVSGGQPGAAAGTLTMMAAAKKEVFGRCHDILRAVGKNIYHVGEKIAGNEVKGDGLLEGTDWGRSSSGLDMTALHFSQTEGNWPTDKTGSTPLA
jgi:3-hydroxyisobutyrate dehydrogenase-like beta-hydroxyacid dehydrogenase